MDLRSAVPAGELPVYVGRERLRGADVRCYVQVRAVRDKTCECQFCCSCTYCVCSIWRVCSRALLALV